MMNEIESLIRNLKCVKGKELGKQYKEDETNIYIMLRDIIECLEHLEVEHRNQLTSEEIDFLLESEEERVSKYGLEEAYSIYVSCKNKLEKQKEMLKECI